VQLENSGIMLLKFHPNPNQVSGHKHALSVAIKSKYFFSNNCYNDLLKPINNILLKPHNVPKDMYESKKMMSALSLKYEKIDVCPENCMLF
jgi:hypothetical protein